MANKEHEIQLDIIDYSPTCYDWSEEECFLDYVKIQIKNIGELALVLKEHGNTIYTNHVNENTNDFANWVEHCIGDIELSNELRNSDNLDHTFEIIQNRILNIVSSTNLKAENMEKNNVKILSVIRHIRTSSRSRL